MVIAGPPLAALSATYHAAAFSTKAPITALKYTVLLFPIKRGGKWGTLGGLLPKGFELSEMAKHAYKVVLFAFDFFAFSLLGLIHPRANIWLHQQLGLTSGNWQIQPKNDESLQVLLWDGIKAAIQTSSISASYDREGKFIPSEEERPNLKLECLEGNLFKIGLISAKKVELPKTSAVEKLTGEQLVLYAKHPSANGCYFELVIDPAEMSQRLHIKKDKLMTVVQSQSLGKFIAARKKKLKALRSVVEHYTSIMKKYEMENDCDKILVSKHSKAGVGITARHLMKVIRAYHRAEFQKGIKKKLAWKTGKPALLSFKNKNGMGQMKMLAQKNSEGSLLISRLDDRVLLGQGTYGICYKIMQLEAGMPFALKEASIAKTKNWQKAGKMVASETKLLNRIHENGPVCNVQAKPHSVVNLLSPAPMIGFIGELYDGDIYELFVGKAHPDQQAFLLKVRGEACRQIILGSVELEKRQIVNCDSKLENTFFKFRKDRFDKIVGIDIFLGDFGGAFVLDEIKTLQNELVHSRFCSPRSDIEAIGLDIKNQDVDSYKKHIKALEIFQKGYMIYNLLTAGENPYGVTGKNADTSKPMDHQKLVDHGVSEHHRALIAKMLDPDPLKRPSFRELAAFW